jgi:hypothetical protein
MLPSTVLKKMLKTTKLILSAQNSRFKRISIKQNLKLSSILNNNLSALEIRSLRDLNSRKDMIKKADKNNMCVIMHKSDYIKEGGTTI